MARLLLIQNMALLMPEQEPLLDFVSRSLENFPGVAAVVQVDEIAPQGPDDSRLVLPIRYGAMAFGALVFEVSDEAAIRPYVPYIQNTMTMIAVILENRIHGSRMALERNQFFEVSRDMMCIAGSDGYFKSLNPRWEETLGWSTEELLSKPFIDFVHPDDVENTLAVLDQHNAGVPTLEFQNRHLCKDGSFRWLEWTSTAEGGTYFCVARDATERKKAEDTLRLHSQAIEQTRFSVLAVDLEWHVTVWNKAAENMFGYSEKEALGRHVSFIYPKDQQKFLKNEVIAPAEKKGWHEIEVRRRRKSGEEFFSRLSLSVLKDAAGKPIGRIGLSIDITERKKTEDTLRLQSQAIEQTHYSVIATDLDWRVTMWNKAAEKMYGYSEKEALGRHLSFIYPEGQKDFLKNKLVAPAEKLSWLDVEVRRRRKSGEEFFVQLSISVLKNAAGKSIGQIGLSVDITERKKTEEALRRSEASLAKAQHIAHIGSWEFDIVTDDFHWSDETYRIFGLEPQEFGATYEAFLATVHPDDRTAVEEALSAALDERALYSIDHRILLPSGEVRFVHEQAEIEHDGDGKPITMRGTVQDITERRQAEEALRLSEQKLSAIFHTGPNFVAVIGFEDGLFHDVNDAWLAATGYSRDEVIGHTTKELKVWVNSEHREQFVALMRKQGFVRNFETEFAGNEGRVMPIMISGEWIEIDGEQRLLAVATDITERKQAEEALRQSERQLSTIFHTSPHIMAITGLEDGLFYDVNDTWLVQTGFTRNEVIGRTAKDLKMWVTPEHREHVVALMKKQGYVRNFETEFGGKEGRVTPVMISIGWIEIDGEQRLLTVSTDITERKRAEAALRRSEAETAEAHALLAEALESSPDSIVLFDADDRLVLFNEEFKKGPLSGISDLVEPGVSFEELVRASVERGLVPIPDGDEEAYIRMRVEHHRAGEGNLEVEMADGGWMLARERRMPGGGIISTRSDITERKRAEAALRKSEAETAEAHALLAEAIESSPDSIALYDADDRLVLFNTACLTGPWSPLSDMMKPGVSFEEMVRASVEHGLILIPDGDEEAYIRGRMERHIACEGVLEIEMTDGRWILLRERHMPGGGIIGTRSDITERKRAEAALRKSEAETAEAHALLAEAIESSPDAIVLYNADDRLVLFNEEFKKGPLSGISDLVEPGVSFEELVRASVERGLVPIPDGDEEAYIRERIEFHHAGEGKLEVEMEDGRWMLVRERHMPGGGIIGTRSEITERKHTEAALKESEETLNAFFSNAPVGMALYDSDIRYLKINKELAWDANLSVDEHIGKALAEIKPEVAKIAEPVYRDVFESGDPTVLLEARAEKPAEPGVDFWWTGFAFPTSWTNGKPSKVGVVVVDITERKQMENELRELNVELEHRVEDRTAELRAAQGELVSKERLATLGQISATVSHELRNPLGTIRNSLVVLENKLGGKNLGAQQSLDRMARNIERCNKIIDDMLDFARARGVELKKTAFDAWLDGVLNELGVPSGVTVRRMLGAPKARPMIDDERIRRAIVNIYDNAYQAMIEEPVGRYPARKKKLTVSTKVTKGRLELAITDNGPGMPPEVFAAAFEPLYSTKGFGVGLGLPIVKQIMEQHGGTIEITSEHGSGTRVVLWLPLGQSTTKTKKGVK